MRELISNILIITWRVHLSRKQAAFTTPFSLSSCHADSTLSFSLFRQFGRINFPRPSKPRKFRTNKTILSAFRLHFDKVTLLFLSPCWFHRLSRVHWKCPENCCRLERDRASFRVTNEVLKKWSLWDQSCDYFRLTLACLACGTPAIQRTMVALFLSASPDVV